jgi:chromosome segregation ATPase
MILQLAKNITVERESGGKPIGDLVFKKNDFSLFVDVTNLDVLKDAFSVTFRVIRKEDNEVIETIGENVRIAVEGRNGNQTNKQAENEYKATKKKLQGDIKDAQKAVNDIQKDLKPLRKAVQDIRYEIAILREELFVLEQLPNPTAEDVAAIDAKKEAILKRQKDLDDAEIPLNAKQTELGAKNDELVALNTSLDTLVEVLPIYEKIDKYSDVVGTYIENNKLTDAGKVWIKTLPLLKGTVGDCVV